MSRPAVSVIMNCLNCSRYLPEAIDSVYAQTFADWEIVFWDNASTDESSRIAQRYDQRLRYFRGDVTVPLGRARNLALAQARAELIAFLDCDDIWLPEKLERQVAVFRARPGVDFVYANFWLLEDATGKRHIARAAQMPEGDIFERFLQKYEAGLLTVMLRASALARAGGLFDESFNLVEEYDLFMRVLYRGEAAYIRQPLAVCRMHGSNTSTIHRDAWFEENARVLTRFRRLDTENRYARAFADAEEKLDQLCASVDMWQGRPRDARARIARHGGASAKSFMLYMLSFAPAFIWKAARVLFKRGLLYR